jgi:hypothetical protein
LGNVLKNHNKKSPSNKTQVQGLKPLAEVVGLGLSGVRPGRMGIGPVEASKRALAMANINMEDVDLIELNEAFAAQSLAVIKELSLPIEKVNVNGGAIALGHPIGNSGARISVTLIHAMRKRQVNYGLATRFLNWSIGGWKIVSFLFCSLISFFFLYVFAKYSNFLGALYGAAISGIMAAGIVLYQMNYDRKKELQTIDRKKRFLTLLKCKLCR